MKAAVEAVLVEQGLKSSVMVVVPDLPKKEVVVALAAEEHCFSKSQAEEGAASPVREKLLMAWMLVSEESS